MNTLAPHDPTCALRQGERCNCPVSSKVRVVRRGPGVPLPAPAPEQPLSDDERAERARRSSRRVVRIG